MSFHIHLISCDMPSAEHETDKMVQKLITPQDEYDDENELNLDDYEDVEWEIKDEQMRQQRKQVSRAMFGIDMYML